MEEHASELVSEVYGGEPYEYYPLGEHVVSAPGICDGEPTFKYTRINVEHIFGLIASGWTVDQVAASYKVPVAAVREALYLARHALVQQYR